MYGHNFRLGLEDFHLFYSLCACVAALSLCFTTSAIAQGVGATTPAKEYIRFSGQTVAIENATAGPVSAGLYDGADPRVQYSGTWSNPVGYNTSTQTGAAASLTFTGAAITYVYDLYYNSGIATVFMDGTQIASIDQYSPQDPSGHLFFRKVTTFSGLTNANHTIKVVVSGQKNGASAGTSVSVGGFIVGAIHNDNASAFAYSGSWADITGLAAAWSGDEHTTSTVGNNVSFTFSGSFVTVIYSESNTAGALVVSVDGNQIDTIDENYAGTGNPPDYYRISRTYTGLSAAAHTLTLTCAASPSVPADTAVNVDGALASQ
jgi:hypothetical protein